jgi:hypothetical protein
VVELERELGDRPGELANRYYLATIDLVQGEDEKARTEFRALLGLARELGDRKCEQETLTALARLDESTAGSGSQ